MQDAQHAQMMERVGDGILQAAKQQELQLDYQLKQMENMDEDDFEVLRIEFGTREHAQAQSDGR